MVNLQNQKSNLLGTHSAALLQLRVPKLLTDLPLRGEGGKKAKEIPAPSELNI